VVVRVGDVMEAVHAAARGELPRFDAIALDLFEGPRGTRREEGDPLWGSEALAALRDALAPGGALGIWCEEVAPRFIRRLARAGLSAEQRRSGRGGRRHALYRARLSASSSRAGRPKRAE
jgi:tRNA U34 5-methylaminomethyl-2-thiouridine-forming methyltransferase MnmC